jgi:hypothetical protein
VSEENVAIVCELHEAFNRGELGAYLSVLDPQFEWNGPREIPDLAGSRYGPEGVRRYLSKRTEVFNDHRISPRPGRVMSVPSLIVAKLGAPAWPD